ncbi:zinc ribbon domain-containing protein [Cylindrospermum sp. FACHB-282]|uniref:zinc ribbon domain-containing protein n=1 Tax=Cylindrospermum sp. FACHB-282 TaxID=2692794 RepID=UPI001687263B|nr:zinc ribbon domain-containing protein [Cylindrospermum sp. FACHB-282]MBD2386983.1 transposase [Cylindrospermum sp. FACHB-282]
MNVSSMLAKAIADMGFFEFPWQLEYKCELYDSQLVVINRCYPSSKTCSRCGALIESLAVSERVYHCQQCGLQIDRDLNAALNLSHGVTSTASACGLDSANAACCETGIKCQHWLAFLGRYHKIKKCRCGDLVQFQILSSPLAKGVQSHLATIDPNRPKSS